MAYGLNTWMLSDEVEVKKEYAKPIEGKQPLYIIDASFNAEKMEYKIKFQSLENDAEFELTYFLQSVKDGQIVKSQWAYNVLIGLGKALFDTEAQGVPFFEDIIHGLVIGNVKMEASKKDPTKKYAKIYEYKPVDADTYEQCVEAGFELRDQFVC